MGSGPVVTCVSGSLRREMGMMSAWDLQAVEVAVLLLEALRYLLNLSCPRWKSQRMEMRCRNLQDATGSVTIMRLMAQTTHGSVWPGKVRSC
jgi:hypothetical protein